VLSDRWSWTRRISLAKTPGQVCLFAAMEQKKGLFISPRITVVGVMMRAEKKGLEETVEK